MFRNNIKALREAIGLSQETLADRAGTTRNYLGKLERGSRRLNQTQIDRIAKALGVEPHEIIGPAQNDERAWLPRPETIAELLAVAMQVDEHDLEKQGELLDYAYAVYTGLVWIAEDPASEDDPGFLKGVRKRVAEAIGSRNSAPSKAA